MKESKDPSKIGDAEPESDSDFQMSRRAAMSALGLSGLGVTGANSVGAQDKGKEPWQNWDGDVDANEFDLLNLGALRTAANEGAIEDFAGENLSISEGTLSAGSTVTFVDIDDYGADPTGEEPSDDALDAAIEELSDGDVLVMTNGEYWFDGAHEIYDDYVTVVGTGSKLRITGHGYGAYSHWLSFGDWTAVSDFGGDTRIAEDVTEGQQTVEVEDVEPFSVGDDITISVSKYDGEPTLSWGGTAGRGTAPTRAVIREIDGSRLYLDRGLNYDYEAGNAGVFLLDSVVGGRFVDLHMTDGAGEGESEGFLMTAYARDCTYVNCTAEEYVGFPFTDIHSLRTQMIDCEAKNPVLPERASSHWEPFQFRGSTDPTVVRPSIDTCRRGIDINAGAKVVTVIEPQIRNAYLHGVCFHSNGTQQVYGAYEIYGGRIEGAAEILHDKYHAGNAASLSPNMSHVKIFGTTLVGVSNGINTPYGRAENLTLEGVTVETNPRSSGTVITGTLANSRLENVELVGRGDNDDEAIVLDGARSVTVSARIRGSFRNDVVDVANAENVTLDVEVLENENDGAADVAVSDSHDVTVRGTLHGAGRAVATSGDVSDLRVRDVDAEANESPAIGYVAGDGPVSKVSITGCNTAGGTAVDVDFESELDDEVAGLWIQNNAVGDISFVGSSADDDKFVTGNITVEPEEGDEEEGITMDGEGTEADPYVITTAEELQNIAIEPGAHFVLGNDIDASATESWNGGDGFEPIDTFSGSLDGAGHTIQGLHIDRPILSEMGMFSEAASGAAIHDLTLEEVDVTGGGYTGALIGVGRDAEVTDVTLTGTVTGERRTGGLAAWHEGTVENADVDATIDSQGNSIAALVVAHLQPGGTVRNSTATGTITARSESGGIAGWDEGVVENCHSEVTLDASDTGYSGGLVGLVINGGHAVDCSTVSDVTGGTGVGAFVGRIYGGTVERCRADGTVTGDDAVGGFVGQNDDEIRNCYSEATVEATEEQAGSFGGAILSDSSITTSYAVGAVSAPVDVGGLVGDNGGTLADSYWDTETTGQSDSVGAGDPGGEGLTTAEMTGSDAESNMSALDFADTWTTTDGYPRLAWE